jgi:hypothetical protein
VCEQIEEHTLPKAATTCVHDTIKEAIPMPGLRERHFRLKFRAPPHEAEMDPSNRAFGALSRARLRALYERKAASAKDRQTAMAVRNDEMDADRLLLLQLSKITQQLWL